MTDLFLPHPYDTTYYYAKIRVESGFSHTISSDKAFNAIAYGMSDGESYGYNAGTNIKAWLFTIMRNIFINNYRRKAKQKTIFDSTPNDYLINLKQVTVSNAAESDMRVKEIKKAIRDLPEIFKTPFLLYFDGYKYNEIAEVLQEPLGTIKSRIHFARKLLKEQISRF